MFVAGFFVAAFQAYDDVSKRLRQEIETKTNSTDYADLKEKLDEVRWAPLTSDEISALQTRLKHITPEVVTIACETPNCKDLANSFETAFSKAGWRDIKIVFGGGLGITGQTGLNLFPGDAITADIIAAIETQLP